MDSWLSKSPGAIVTGNAGEEAFRSIVGSVIDVIQAVLGDSDLTKTMALAWAAASDSPPAIEEALRDERKVLLGYWEGGAHEAFSAHLDDIFSAMDETSRRLYWMAQKIAKTYSLVHDTYESQVRVLSSCAANLIGLSALPFSLMRVADFITGFVEAVMTFYQDALATMNDYKQEVIFLEIDAMTFPTLPDSPDTLDRIGDVEDWDVQERTN